MALHTIIIPTFNEAESLVQLHSEIDSVASSTDFEVEMIFVDDGSSDGSWNVIESLSDKDSRVRGIRFRRNFGKACALDAGIRASRGEFLITMDADLQDDPKEIPAMLAALHGGDADSDTSAEAGSFDLVSGWKKQRHDPIHKTFPSKIFNWLVGAMTGVRLHDHNCGFKCYRREVFDDVQLYGERHRFIPVLASAYGWRVTEHVVEHRARKHGTSKYGFTRFIKGLLDLMTVYFLTGFRNRPLHLLGTIGLGSFGLGAIGLGYLAIYWLVRQIGGFENWAALHERPLLLYSLGAMLLGAQLISIGFIAELITATQRPDASSYSVRSTLNLPGKQTPLSGVRVDSERSLVDEETDTTA